MKTLEDSTEQTAEGTAAKAAEHYGTHPQHIDISGRFDKYRSSFWAAAVAALGARYLPRPFLRNSMKDSNPNFFTKHLYSGLAGVAMESVTAVFAYSTWKDMRNVFAEPLAWEFNKDPKDVSFSDFRHSKNSMVKQTLGNYINYNLRRAAINLTYFSPYIFKPVFEKSVKNRESMFHPQNWHSESGADFALGANALYLLSDVFTRKATPFEAMQAAIDSKINHAESFADRVAAVDLLNIYERHAEKTHIQSFAPQRGTQKWERSMELFSRMAELMNQTYSNEPRTEQANFTIGKFIYLVGNHMINPDQPTQTEAYIEVVNRYGVESLKEMVHSMSEGKSLGDALKPFPVTMHHTDDKDCPVIPAPVATDKHIDKAHAPSSYADQVKRGNTTSPHLTM